MGLFDKKVCVICGRQFGLLGGGSIADGHLCNDCKRKFSPYATKISKMTTEEVKRHLEYREKNEQALTSFKPDQVLCTGKKFYYDSSKESFLLSDRSDWRSGNPDIISRKNVVNAEYHISEEASEIYKDEETKESYDPKKYEYEYTFTMKLTIDSPYFSSISFTVKDGDQAENKNDENYNRHEYTCRMIQHIVCPDLYPEPELKEPTVTVSIEPETWDCSCGQKGNIGRFCSACGKERIVTWDCPFCGQKGNTGRFCSSCGKEKTETFKWFCPDCGAENTGKFCSSCGREIPDNVKNKEVKRITPALDRAKNQEQ